MVEQPWREAIDHLSVWHSKQDRRAAAAALAFVEVELRLRIPPAARRRWPREQVEDALQSFLLRLIQKPLPTLVEHPAAYLTRMFRNWCIDIERGRQRAPTEPWEDATLVEQIHPEPSVRQDLERLTAALAALSIDDRVAIKMTDAPEILTWEEFDWLGSRAGLSALEVRDRVMACPPVFELTLLFDPGEAPADAQMRRDRMERFRKRRERARQRLRDRLGRAP